MENGEMSTKSICERTGHTFYDIRDNSPRYRFKLFIKKYFKYCIIGSIWTGAYVFFGWLFIDVLNKPTISSLAIIGLVSFLTKYFGYKLIGLFK